jgi:aryl-alcohol dehydrogenase-like predicted oxidoreductase
MAGDATMQLGALNVRRLGFGTMQLTGPGVWGPPSDHDGAAAVLRRSVELGVNLIDTADSYGPNVVEELVREALQPYPDGLVIATKAGFTRSGPNQWHENGDPVYLRRQCEGSLRRLGVDQIDLFQLHRIDPRIDADEQFGILKALRDEGKVREVGLSQVNVEQIEAARRVVPVVSVQNLYNIAQRQDDDVVAHCEQHRIAFIPWFPLGSGKFAAGGGPLDEVAAEYDATVHQICLAWLLRRSPVMLPIPGTSSLEHLEENCGANNVALSEATYQELTDSRKAIRRWAMSN